MSDLSDLGQSGLKILESFGTNFESSANMNAANAAIALNNAQIAAKQADYDAKQAQARTEILKLFVLGALVFRRFNTS